MNKDVEFLNYIYQNASMGVIGIDHIKDKIINKELKEHIRTQRSEYENIVNSAISLIDEYNECEKDINVMAKIMTYFTANFELLKDNSESNIAKIMIEGSNKGVIEINKKLNMYKPTNKKIEKLAKKLLATEEHNINELKKYL